MLKMAASVCPYRTVLHALFIPITAYTPINPLFPLHPNPQHASTVGGLLKASPRQPLMHPLRYFPTRSRNSTPPIACLLKIPYAFTPKSPHTT